MTKDIIKLSATFLGLTDVLDYIKNPSTQPSTEVSNKIEDLLLFTNYILREITKSYFPLLCEEEVTSSTSCEIPFSSLSQSAVAIKSIKNGLGQKVTFNLYPNFIKVGTPSSKYMVSYNYVPEKIQTIDQALELPLGLGYEVVAYGVASEYALSKLLYSEADMWESRFKNSLENVKNRAGDRRFFSRRLI